MDEEILLLKTAVIEENHEKGRETDMAMTLPVENHNGFVFGVAEAKSRSIFAQTVMEIICDRLARLAETVQDSTSILRRFEQTLEAINEELAEQAVEMETFNPGELNALIGLAVDRNIYFSGSGELPAIFLHKLPEGKYQIFNLARSVQTEQAAASWQKIFVVVLDGDLSPGDVLCLCNKNLRHEIPAEELHTLLASLPPQSAAVKLRQYFPLEANLAMFILHVGGEEDRRQVSAPASLKQLQAAREQTRRILSDQKPTLATSLNSTVSSLFKNRRGYSRLAKNLLRLLVGSAVVAFFMLRDLLRFFFRLSRRLLSSERKEIFKETQTRFTESRRLLREKFRHLPKSSRYLLLATAAMVLIIVVSIIMISRGRMAGEERAAFAAAITKIETLRDAAQSALIYKDENKARALLLEAETAAAAIVTDDKEGLARLAEVKAEVAAAANSLRRIVEIENPEIFANNSIIQTLSLINNEIYSIAGDKNVYRLNRENKTFEAVASGEFNGASEAAADGAIIAWLDQSVINLFDSRAKTIKAAASAPSSEKWLDLYAYADRVYVLSPGSGLTSQVYKLIRADMTLGAPTAWIKSPITELADGISLAVDGTVFVLRSNGKILRFVSGRDVAWTQSEVDPVMISASDIWTSSDSSYVYVLDPVGQRVVVYEKDSGRLAAQYHSTAFTGLVDFAVDETNKTIYLLGNGNIYKISATHLK
jgi:hypothetical protein